MVRRLQTQMMLINRMRPLGPLSKQSFSSLRHRRTWKSSPSIDLTRTIGLFHACPHTHMTQRPVALVLHHLSGQILLYLLYLIGCNRSSSIRHMSCNVRHRHKQSPTLRCRLDRISSSTSSSCFSSSPCSSWITCFGTLGLLRLHLPDCSLA